MSISATSGLVSNIDYQSLISQLISIKRQPIQELNSEKSTLDRASSAYSSLSSRVQELKSAADDLRTAGDFNVFSTSVSDDTVLGASAGSTAAKGTYDIVITSLAKAHKIAADGVAAESSVITAGAGSFSFQVGSAAVETVTVDATTTLADLRNSINNLGAGVTASILNDGDAAVPYRLVLTSDTTGTSNGITITQNDTTLAFNTTLQAATDAAFTVDTLSITKSTNTVTDVIEGVTLDLKSADAAKTITVAVDTDRDEIQTKITAFVEKYNAVVSHIKANNRYDSETKKAGVFFGDPVARSIWDDLRRQMTGSVTGLPDTMNRLIHIGITTSTEGTMSIDSSELSTALASNFDDVKNLLIDGTSTTGMAGLIYDLAGDIDDFADGRIKKRMEGISRSITNIETGIRNREREVERYETMIRNQFTGLETMIATMKAQSNFLSGIGG